MTDTELQPVDIDDVGDIVADLEAMDDDTYRAIIKFPDGKRKRYTLGKLGYVEYNEIVLSVPLPQKPRKYNREAGGFVDNPTPEYAAKYDAAIDRRRLMLLAASIDKQSPLKGATLAEKADFLGKRSADIVAALLSVFAQAHHGLEGRLEQHAATFHGLSDASAEGETALGAENAG